MKEYTGYVNPFIGTGGHGHTHPGAMLPHGMIQPGPDTRIDGWNSCSGYYYEDSTINGFAHTRLSGTGCADFGDFLLMPTVGEQKVEYLGKESQQRPFASAFSHRNEYAEPGYYSVFLDTYGVKAELTATERAAMHRYTFPESKESGFILDMDYNIQQQTNLVMEVEAVNDTVLCGYKRSAYWAWQQDLYFYAVFSKPFTHTLYTDTIEEGGQQIPVCKMLLRFDTAEDEQVMVRFSISSVDGEGARQNLLAELPDWDFDKVRADARKTWNDCLSKIEVKTEDPDQLAIFYTAMYHAFLSPNLFTDVDGRYLGMDLKVHTTDKEDPVYTTFSIWDTFRALHPLLTIIDPHTNESYIRSLLKKQREGGVFPKWDCAANYTGTMIGYHAASIITDAYLENESVAKALEYAYDDWCISVLADSLGDVETRDKYARFAGAYKSYFDPETRFMRGRDSKGKWRTPFNPRSSTHRSDDYCEGTAWQWTWFVPHDVPGLVGLMGGEEAFAGKLDSLFTVSSKLEGETVSADISGLIGQYAHGNEPSHHIIHLYNYVNRPWRTQELVDSVLNAMGFYQVCPGEPVYSIGRPLFEEVTIHLPGQKDFVIRTKNNSKENKYVQSILLNGKPLEQPFFTHSDLTAGGVMEISMGAEPFKP